MKVLRSLCLLVAGAAIVFSACKKHDCSDYMNEAVLTGYDLRACACCGGMLLNMGSDTQKYAAGYYVVESMPSGFVIDSISSFPIPVRINWNPVLNQPCGMTNHIVITSMERQ